MVRNRRRQPLTCRVTQVKNTNLLFVKEYLKPMAQMINLTVFEGYLGADAEVKALGNGKSVVNYRLAHTRRFKGGDGTAKDETTWMSVVDWKPSAPNLAKFLTKGRNIKVIGRLQSRDYEDKNGNKRTSIEIVADEVLLGSDGNADKTAVAAGGAEVYDWAETDTETKPW